jgi:DnaJ-class molecular chaperone
MKEIAVHTRFVPEKYCMKFCPQCNGPGKFIHGGMEAEVCNVCGGFGLVKNRSSKFEEDGTYLVIPSKP